MRSSAPSGGNPPPSYPFSSASTAQFVVQFGTGTFVQATNQGDTVSGLAQDGSGNMYVAGYTAGNLGGSNGTVGVLKGALYKLDPQGNQIWARELTTDAGDTLAGVAVTANGAIVAGDTMGAYPGMSNPSGTGEPFVALYNSNGSLLWIKQFAAPAPVQVETMTADSAGNILLGGEIGDSQGGQNLWLAKVDSSGALQWQKTYGTAAVDVLLSVSSDSSGGLYAVGTTIGPFPGGISNAKGVPFVLKLDEVNGATIWLQQFKNDSVLSAMYPSAVALSPDKHLYVLGEVGSYGSTDAIALVQMDPETGNTNWKFQFGSGGRNLPGGSIAFDSAGNVFVAGMTGAALTATASVPTQDVFLAKISASGSPTWAQQIGTGQDGPALQSTGSTPIYLSAGTNNIVLGGITAGQFAGASNPNHALELFVAKFGQ